MTCLIGTSGWQYKHWRETVYPKGVPQRLWLEYYAERYRTVEINNSFYMLPKPEAFASWARRTPDDFIAVVKLNRYITHIKRLRDCEDAIDRFLEHARHLGSKLGPLLVQLPPNLRADAAALDACLERLGKVQVAVEFRHETWFTDEIKAILERHNAPLCWADRGSRPIAPFWRTADWGYLRFHQGLASPIPCYGKTAMRSWAERLTTTWGSDETTYVFFNNDPRGCAVRDSIVFAREIEARGDEATRVPEMHEVRIDTGE